MSDRDALVAELVIDAIPNWAVLVVRLNGLIAGQLGVPDADVLCLHTLGHHGPMTPGALAKHVNLLSLIHI